MAQHDAVSTHNLYPCLGELRIRVSLLPEMRIPDGIWAIRLRGLQVISIVILAYDQHEMTAECLLAVRRTVQHAEIVFVDNGSATPYAKPYMGFLDVQFIRNEVNQGFPRAVNQAIAAATGDIIVLLNNDVIVTPGWLEKVTAPLLDEDDQYAITAPVTNYCAGLQCVQVGTYENEDELAKAAEEWAEHYGDQVRPVQWVIGFVMAFPKSLWTDLGPFDDSMYPCSGEEIDFCFRAGQAGHRVGIVYGCYVHHEGSVTLKATCDDYAALCERTGAHLAERWGADFWQRQLPPFVQGEGVRLNLGCGQFPLAGFVNVDTSRDAKADLTADVLDLPYQPGTVDEIYAGHLLEHFPYKDGQRALKYWHSLLREDGLLSVTVPDFDVLCARYLEDPTPEQLRELNDVYIYSTCQASPHRYAYSGALLAECLEAAGFTDLEQMPENHPYFPCAVDWQVGFHARKRASHAAE